MVASPVLDPDLEMSGGGVGGSSSRPLDKGGRDGFPKTFFRAFGPKFSLKIRGREARVPRASPQDPPL